MVKYRGTNPDYDEPSDEPDQVAGQTAVEPTGVVSGQISIYMPAITVNPRPQNATQIVRWLADDKFPRPLVAIVDVKGPFSAGVFSSQAALLAQGAGERVKVGPAGVLQLTYGSGNALRVIESDLRSGSYQIPACNTCTVSAFAYQWGPILTHTISVALVPGLTVNPSRAINSVQTLLTAGESVALAVPFGARWVSMMGGPAVSVGAGAPRLTLYEDAANRSGAAIIQDYAAGVFVGAPGAMVELAGARAAVTVKNESSADARVTVRFGLEI